MVLNLFRIPCTHLIEDRKRLIETTRRNHPITVKYASSRFSAIIAASLLKKVVASPAIPPLVVNTSGVNEPPSISRTLLPYSVRFFVRAVYKAIAVGCSDSWMRMDKKPDIKNTS